MHPNLVESAVLQAPAARLGRGLPASRRAARALALALPLALLGTSGCDNPSCVFGPGNCQPGNEGNLPGGGVGTRDASDPFDGATLLPGRPSVTYFAPTGDGAHPSTPIFVEFSESIDPESLGGAFELVDPDIGQPLPITDPAPLVAGGRVAIILPVAPLPEGRSFAVRLSSTGEVSDLSGQALATTGQLGEFTVEETASTTPRVVATFPADSATGENALGSILVAFDRPIDNQTVDRSSFDVTVDGADPPFDPRPLPVFITGAVIPVEVPQVYQWRSIDDDGQPVSLGVGATVTVDLSTTGNEIVSEDSEDDPLPPTSFSFTLADFAAPRAVFKDPMAEPIDAIGMPNLEDGAMPVVFVEFEEPYVEGDTLGVYLFGTSPALPDVTQRPIARFETIELPAPATDSATISADQLNLFTGAQANFADGQMSIAVRLERGEERSTLRVFDSDPDDPGPQPLLFDVTAPTLVGLGGSGLAQGVMQSTSPDLVLVGVASEPLARVDLSATDGTDSVDNLDGGTFAEVTASDAAGLFIARPAPVGVIEPGATWSFTAQLYDRALNQAEAPATGVFVQSGHVAVGGVPSAGMITVNVYDSVSFAPLGGALVLAHQNDGGTYSFIESQVTGIEDGSVEIQGATSGATVLTIDLEDYDLFTFSGVLGTTIDVPLRLSAQQDAETEGQVVSPSLTADIGSDIKFVADTRRDVIGDPLLSVGGCEIDPITFQRTCRWGPDAIEPGRLGGQSFIAADFDLNSGTFSAGGFLRAFEVTVPARPAAPEMAVPNLFVVSELLLNAEGEEQPIAATPATLSEPTSDTWGTVENDPEVTIEASANGLSRALAVGLGLAFAQSGDAWLLLAAHAGVADGIEDTEEDELGELVQAGTIDADLLYRVELEDDLGNRVGIRPRFSSDLLSPPTLQAPDPPTLQSPAAAATTGGTTYDLVFDDVVLDAFGQEAFYRVQLADGLGRAWTLWTRDASGDPDTITVKVPNIGSQGGTPLANGAIRARVSFFALPELDLDASPFLWEELERYERFGHAAEVLFTQGN